jgi:hypothetical protein
VLQSALGDSWPAVLHALTEAQSKLTRQQILDNWSADTPDKCLTQGDVSCAHVSVLQNRFLRLADYP